MGKREGRTGRGESVGKATRSLVPGWVRGQAGRAVSQCRDMPSPFHVACTPDGSSECRFLGPTHWVLQLSVKAWECGEPRSGGGSRCPQPLRWTVLESHLMASLSKGGRQKELPSTAHSPDSCKGCNQVSHSPWHTSRSSRDLNPCPPGATPQPALLLVFLSQG